MSALTFIFQKTRLVAKTFPNRALLLTYLKILAVEVGLVKMLRLRPTNENIFGYKVYFFHHSSFVSMFEDIFIENVYFFKTDKRKPYIIDGGTNIGLELFYYKNIYPECSILCFEPDKETFSLLQKNIRANNLKNIKVINSALSSVTGTRYLYNDLENPGSLIMSLAKERGLKNKISVMTNVLSKYIDRDVDFLKLDIEGEEYEVLYDLIRHKKLTKIQKLIVEYHHHIGKRKSSFGTFLSILEKNNFRYQIVTGLRTPFVSNVYQDILIFAYQK